MIDDVHFAGFTDLYERLEKSIFFVSVKILFVNLKLKRCDQSTFGFSENNVFNIMETTRFLNDTDFNLDHWPIWKTIFTVFESNENAKYSEGFQSCVTESVNKMMLFSEHREVYKNYWNSLHSTKLLQNYFPDLRRTDHQSKMSAILVKWFCMMDNEYCLEQTKKNFDDVKNGSLRPVSFFF